MQQTKRARPSFSPPRPKKKTNASNPKSASSKSTTLKAKAQSKAKTTVSGGASKTKSKTGSKSTDTNSHRRSRLVSPTPSASDSQNIDSDTDNDSDIEDIEFRAAADEDPNDEPSSPEPDYILAEVTHSPPPTDPPIPLGLIHRSLHAHFAAPEKTKISTDAKEIVGKYIEVFVREAIMRCAFEKSGDVPDASGQLNENAPKGGGGWLEMEDLEKVAVQLCLDF